MTELAFLSASTLAAKIRTREISCIEMLDYFVARNTKYHGALNAIIWTDLERAANQAKAADGKLAEGETLGPLHGVPMTVRECFAWEGSPATFGVPKLRNNFATRNALAVDRLLRAGAIHQIDAAYIIARGNCRSCAVEFVGRSFQQQL